MNTVQTPSLGSETRISNSTRALRVLTLTPFYPSTQDAAQGCFVAEPLACTVQLGIANEVMAVQPFYRRGLHVAESAVSSQWRNYFSLPGNLGLATAGNFLAAGIRKAVRGLHRQNPFDLIHAHAALPCGQAAAAFSWELRIPFVVSVMGSTPSLPGKWAGHGLIGVMRNRRKYIAVPLRSFASANG